MKREWCFGASLVVLALAVCACGGSSDKSLGSLSPSSSSSTIPASNSVADTPAPSQLDACQLLTPAEAGTFLKVTVTATKSGPQDCDFANEAGKTVHVAVSVGSAKFDANVRQFNPKELTGIGDAAFLSQPNSLVFFKKGQNVVEMQYGSALVGQSDVDAFVTLAKQAAARS
jgi:hypothetical protein